MWTYWIIMDLSIINFYAIILIVVLAKKKELLQTCRSKLASGAMGLGPQKLVSMATPAGETADLTVESELKLPNLTK